MNEVEQTPMMQQYLEYIGLSIWCGEQISFLLSNKELSRNDLRS